MAEHVVGEFVGEHRRQLGIVRDIFGQGGRDLDIAAVGPRVEAAAPATSWKRLAQPCSASTETVEPLAPAADRELGPAVGEGRVERREDPLHPRRTSRRGRRAARRRPAVEGEQDVVGAQPGPLRRPARGQRQHAGPASSPNARIAAARKSAPYCERSWTTKPGSQSARGAQLDAGDREPVADRRTRWSSARMAASERSPAARGSGGAGAAGGGRGGQRRQEQRSHQSFTPDCAAAADW